MKITIERKYKKERYTIGNLFINGQWICNTLELPDAGLRQEMPLWEVKQKKVFGEMAIPTGVYRIKSMISPKFGERRAYLQGVPAFTRIMIHEGNSRKDTLGCILVGMNTQKGRVTDSKKILKKLNDMIFKAEERCEPVVISVR